MSSKQEQMWEYLKDSDFRKQFIDAHVDEGVAFQIRSLRTNKKKQTQPEFAQELGVQQSLISSWENPNYGKYSLNTLKKLAKAFDVGLLVRFVPFSALIDWTVNLTSDVIAPPSFNEEQPLVAAPVTAGLDFMTAEAYLAIAGDTKNLVLFGFDKPITNVGAATETIEPNIEKEKVYANTW